MADDLNITDQFENWAAELELKMSRIPTKPVSYRPPQQVLDDPLYNLTVPGLKIVGFNDPEINALGMVLNRSKRDNIYINVGLDQSDPAFTLAHEREHLLQKRGLGDPENINAKFDALIGNNSDRRQMVIDLLGQSDYLKTKYGVKDAYFNPKIIQPGYNFAGVAESLLYEQFASLGAIEAMQGVKLTDDPVLRKTVFNSAAKRETFNAMVGLRQTRLDSKDLAPYTRVAEKPQETSGMLADFMNRILNKMKPELPGTRKVDAFGNFNSGEPQ